MHALFLSKATRDAIFRPALSGPAEPTLLGCPSHRWVLLQLKDLIRRDRRDRTAVVEALVRSWESRSPTLSQSNRVEVFRFNGLSLHVTITGDFVPSAAKKKLKYLGFDEEFIDAFIAFRKSHDKGYRRGARKTDPRRKFLRRADRECRGVWLRDALPEKARLSWGRQLAKAGYSWDHARVEDAVFATALCNLFPEVEEDSMRKFVREWRKQNPADYIRGRR